MVNLSQIPLILNLILETCYPLQTGLALSITYMGGHMVTCVAHYMMTHMVDKFEDKKFIYDLKINQRYFYQTEFHGNATTLQTTKDFFRKMTFWNGMKYEMDQNLTQAQGVTSIFQQLVVDVECYKDTTTNDCGNEEKADLLNASNGLKNVFYLAFVYYWRDFWNFT